MSPTWRDQAPPAPPKLTASGVAMILLRIPPLAVLVFGGLALSLILRLIERPLCHPKRPVTSRLTRIVCRGALRIIGMQLVVQGTPLNSTGAMVANHSSWLDIFALNAATTGYFVSKSEVAGWPGIGWLARATGTIFVKRHRAEAKTQTQTFETRLRARHRLIFFPEGTSTDGQQVLSFKTTLFHAFFADDIKSTAALQPVSVFYTPPPGQHPTFYGWWGDMDFGPHLLSTLAPLRQGGVEVVFHTPIPVAQMANRKEMAAACEAAVRAGHAASRTAAALNR